MNNSIPNNRIECCEKCQPKECISCKDFQVCHKPSYLCHKESEINQCDGCSKGMELREGKYHYWKNTLVMICQKDRYKESEEKCIHSSFPCFSSGMCKVVPPVKAEKEHDKWECEECQDNMRDDTPPRSKSPRSI